MSPAVSDALWVAAGAMVAMAIFMAWWEMPHDDD